jgi:hypothetical protein
MESSKAPSRLSFHRTLLGRPTSVYVHDEDDDDDDDDDEHTHKL